MARADCEVSRTKLNGHLNCPDCEEPIVQLWYNGFREACWDCLQKNPCHEPPRLPINDWDWA